MAEFRVCSLASNLVHNDFYLIGQFWQIFVGAVTIVLYFLTRGYIVRKLMSKEAALLMNYLLLSVALHSVVFIGTQIHHIIYDFYFIPSECALLLSNLGCMIVRVDTQCFTINISILFLCLCVERTLVTFPSKKNTARSNLFCKAASIWPLVTSVLLAFLIYYPDAYEDEMAASCLFHTHSSIERIDLMYYGLILSNTVALVWMLVLYLLNKKAENRTDDPLHVRYQVKENLTITKILMVAGSVQTLLIVSHSVLNLIRRSIPMDMVLYRVLALDGYMISYANLSFMVLLYAMLRLQDLSRKRTIQSDVSHYRQSAATSYFNQYRW